MSNVNGQLELRYKIDNSDVFTDNVPVFQKEGMLHFKIPNDIFFDSTSDLFSGTTLKIELKDSFEDKFYKELSLHNSSKALQKAFNKCNADFREETEKKRKTQEEATRQAQEEAARKAQEEAPIVQSILSLINDRITAGWVRPQSARNGMKTQLRIYFLPNGTVMDAQVTNGSGDALFDQRAVDAVYKVERIEELSELDSYVFERNFRIIDIVFNAQDLRR